MTVQTGIINIRGKEYQTVALRVQLFREQHPDHSLTTAVIHRDEECVVMQATISDAAGRVIANGHSEEYRKSSQINRTSALENAETSAIGRALAAFGLGGTEFASANEVENAIHQQANGGAARGTKQESAVSPPQPTEGRNGAPAARTKLDGPYTSGTQLKTAVREFTRSMHGCGDWDEWLAFRDTKDVRELLEQVKRDMPQWWDGGPDMPEEFVPLHRQIELHEAALGQQIADIARV